MRLIKITGAALLVLAGYLMRSFTDPRLSGNETIQLGLLAFALIVIGLTAMFTTDTKSLKKHIMNILNGLPI